MTSILAARNRVRWSPHSTVLPMQTTRRQSLVGAVFALLFGLVWCGLLGASIIFGTIKEGPNLPMTLMLLVFMVPGLGVLALALHLLVNRRKITVERHAVTVNERRVRGRRQWQEPLSNYRGVLKKRVQHQGSRGTGGHTEYSVVLSHADASKEIVLFEALGGIGIDRLWHESWRQFSDLLALQPLEQTEEGIVVASGAGERTTLLEKAEQGTVSVIEAETIDLGRLVKHRRHGSRWILTYWRGWGAWRAAVGMLISAVLVAAGRYFMLTGQGDRLLAIFVWVAAGFGVLMALSVLHDLFTTDELSIDQQGIVYQLLPRRSPRRRRELRASEVERVRSRADEHGEAVVIIEGPGKPIRFGTGLPLSNRVAVKQLVVAVIAEGVQSLGKTRIVAPLESPQVGRQLLAFGAVVVAFFGALAVLMHFAFSSRPGTAQASSQHEGVQPASQHQTDKGSQADKQPISDAEARAFWVEWNRHYAAGEAAVKADLLEAAEGEFRLALDTARKSGINSQLLSSLRYLGWTIERQGRSAEAAAVLAESLQITLLEQDVSRDLVNEHGRVADLFEQGDDLESALRLHRRALHLAEQRFDHDHQVYREARQRHRAFCDRHPHP